MKIKKYYANFYGTPGISVVWVDDESGKSVKIKGRHESKKSRFGCFADTWEEAHQWMISTVEKRIEQARSQLDYCLKEKEKILSLQKEDKNEN